MKRKLLIIALTILYFSLGFYFGGIYERSIIEKEIDKAYQDGMQKQTEVFGKLLIKKVREQNK